MRKILVTGRTGLIGKEIGIYLDGYEVVSTDSRTMNLCDKDSIRAVIDREKPDGIIHLAWITGGDYLSNPMNYLLREGSLFLLEEFYKQGGERAVLAGTCFEYDLSADNIDENTPLNPKTIYAREKVSLWEDASSLASTYGCEIAWGRIFYVYGHNEKEGRLTSSIISNLLNDKEVIINHSELMRDYMYSKDVAHAFVKLLESNYNGAINICTGEGVSLGDYAKTIASFLNKENMIILNNEETNQPPRIIGNNTMLKERVGFEPQYSLKQGLMEILNGQLRHL